MRQHKTSSFTIDLNSSTFNKFYEKHQIFQYSLPDYLKYKKNNFGILHNWAKASISKPYFLHFPTKRIYVLYELNDTPDRFCFEEKELPYTKFIQYKDPSKVHIWLKVLLAQLIELNSDFVSNDTFYIHSEVNKSRSWATVLKIALQHDYKNKETLVFNIVDSATRLKCVSLEEYEQFHSRDIPYGLSLKQGRAVFKQLKKCQLKERGAKIFVKPKPVSGNKFRSKIDYHSIMDERHHEKSRSFLVQNFLMQFINYLNDYDIVTKNKQLDLVRLDKKKEKENLQIKEFNISLVDGRVNKQKNLEDIIKVPNELKKVISFQPKEKTELISTDCALFVMDYNKDDFLNFFNDLEDPYDEFKKIANLNSIPSQGICINEVSFLDDKPVLSQREYFDYEGLNGTNLSRNLSICITQLYLKHILVTGESNLLPRKELIENKVFLHKNMMLFVSNGQIITKRIECITEFVEVVGRITGRNDIVDILFKIDRFHNPFPKDTSELDTSKLRLMVSGDSVTELIDYPERVYYDDKEIQTRIKNRNLKHPVSKYKVDPISDFHEKYNEYIDNHVEELSLSYEELKTKYGKGEEGFLKSIFYFGQDKKSYKDTPFRKFLKENTGLEFKGLKEEKIFATYSGIWFDRDQMQYFVGRSNTYEFKQDKGFQMKKIIIHDGNFQEDEFFPLLNIDFVRYKELTVNPFPFKLIEINEELFKQPSLK